MEQGDWVIVYGDDPHPEVQGILGWANSVFDEKPEEKAKHGEKSKSKVKLWGARRAICAKSVEEIEAALAADGTPAAKIRQIALISQTTQNTEWYKEFVRDVVDPLPRVRLRGARPQYRLPAHSQAPARSHRPGERGRRDDRGWRLRVGQHSPPPRYRRRVLPCLPHRTPRAARGSLVQRRQDRGVTAGASTPDYVIKKSWTPSKRSMRRCTPQRKRKVDRDKQKRELP